MRTRLTLLGLLIAAAACAGEETLREVSWSRLKAEDARDPGRSPGTGGQVLPPDETTPFEQLKLTNDRAETQNLLALRCADAGITKQTFAVIGKIRWENVENPGYLQMDIGASPREFYFSRAIGADGRQIHIHGSAPWREFVLPFSLADSAKQVLELRVYATLKGRGTVYLSPLTIKQYDPGEAPFRRSLAWWPDWMGGMIGGIGGGVLGCLGGLVGVLGGIGRGRRFVLTLTGACCVLGVIVLGVGLFAVAKGQPYGVWYPLVLGGGLAAVLFGVLLPVARWGYLRRELRTMRAQDA